MVYILIFLLDASFPQMKEIPQWFSWTILQCKKAFNPLLPSSISVTQHSSSAPDGLWTLASMAPFAPFRLTAKEAGWFTFNPDSCINMTLPHSTQDQKMRKSLVFLHNTFKYATALHPIGLYISYLQANRVKERGFETLRNESPPPQQYTQLSSSMSKNRKTNKPLLPSLTL